MQGAVYTYEHPPAAPSFESTSIEWEQSIVEGHPIYPVRCGFMTC